MTYNILIAGVGGQGTVLASKLLANAALRRGFTVRTTETIGMAQRGGSVVGHVRLARGAVFSPLIPLGQADALIAFEPAEAARHLPYLSGRGLLVVCDSAVMPVTSALTRQPYDVAAVLAYLKDNVPKLVIIPGSPVKDHGTKMLNTALLGAAAQGGAFPLSADDLLETIAAMPRYAAENIASFNLGRKLYDEYAG